MIEFSEQAKIIDISLAHYFLGEIYYETGEYQKSIDNYEKAIITAQRFNFSSWSWTNLIKIALAKVRFKNNEKENVDLESLYASFSLIKVKHFESEARRKVGEILLIIDDKHICDAEDWIRKAIEVGEKNGMMFELAMAYKLYADLFKRKDDFPKVKENLIKAIEIFKECGADGWVEKAEMDLAVL
jgi:tetratricopeptide (TPR) repeat protein